MELLELTDELQRLLATTGEHEVLEFKTATNSYDFTKLGRYFSALSNEANLKNKLRAWLVFGVEPQGHTVVGTAFRHESEKLRHLKSEVANKTTNRITFIDIHEVHIGGKRVVMFEIPPAPKGIPVAFEGHYYARDGEELCALNIEKQERIRGQRTFEDWSAVIVPEAGLQDLDPEAIKKARENYLKKFPEKAAEMEDWGDHTFLNKAKITIKGQITRAAIILLGREESEHFLSPTEVKIRWKLKNAAGDDEDHLVLTCPFLLSVDRVFNKIRHLKYRYMRDADSLFPDEVDKYEPYTIREAINNCIAHQDYTVSGRINVIELPDQLVFTNRGEFIPGSVERVVIDDAPEEVYRNRFLATAMFNVNMVETAGGGIRKMFDYQKQRLFPMPEYDLGAGRVEVRITGKVLDLQFARTLVRNRDLTLEEIIMLDKVQKRKPITQEEAEHLRDRKLIEGRRPNCYISLGVARKIGRKADYTKNKGLDKNFYVEMVKKALKQHDEMTRADLDDLLLSKLPDSLDAAQKKMKIGNLLSELRMKGLIRNTGTRNQPKWVLCHS